MWDEGELSILDHVDHPEGGRGKFVSRAAQSLWVFLCVFVESFPGPRERGSSSSDVKECGRRAPRVPLHSLAVFHLVINHHLRRIDSGFFFRHLQCLVHCQVKKKTQLQGSQKHIHEPFPSSPARLLCSMHMYVGA